MGQLVVNVESRRGNADKKKAKSSSRKCGDHCGDRLLIDPRTSKFLSVWDFLGSLPMLYTAIATPYEVAFLEPDANPATPRFIIDRIVDVFFVLDMILQFFIMFEAEPNGNPRAQKDLIQPHDKQIEMVKRFDQIAWNYLNTWFVVDFISVLTVAVDTLPLVEEKVGLQIIESASGEGAVGEGITKFRVLRLLRVVRLVKLVRLVKATRILKRWWASFALDFSTLTVVNCILGYLYFGHLLACLLVLGVSLAETPLYTWKGSKKFCVQTDDPHDVNNEFFQPYKTWVLMPPPSNPDIAHLTDVWCVGPYEMWVLTFYWMIMLISGAAGGDTDARYMNPSESMLFMFCTIVACLINSVIIASLCDVLSNMNPEGVAFRNSMDQLNRYCRKHKLGQPTRIKLREYLYRSQHVQVGKSQQALMMLLSQKLQGELSLQVNGPWLMTIPFLRGIEAACSVRISLTLEPMVFVPTELLNADAMYHVSKGTVIHRGLVLLGGSVFGDDCILQRISLRSLPGRALTYVDVTRVTRKNLLSIVYDKVDGASGASAAFKYPLAADKVRWSAIWLAMRRWALQYLEKERKLAGVSHNISFSNMLSSLSNMETGDPLEIEEAKEMATRLAKLETKAKKDTYYKSLTRRLAGFDSKLTPKKELNESASASAETPASASTERALPVVSPSSSIEPTSRCRCSSSILASPPFSSTPKDQKSIRETLKASRSSRHGINWLVRYPVDSSVTDSCCRSIEGPSTAETGAAAAPSTPYVQGMQELPARVPPLDADYRGNMKLKVALSKAVAALPQDAVLPGRLTPPRRASASTRAAALNGVRVGNIPNADPNAESVARRARGRGSNSNATATATATATAPAPTDTPASGAAAAPGSVPAPSRSSNSCTVWKDVGSCLLWCSIYFATGSAFFMNMQGWNVWESLYFLMGTAATVGYGDLHPDPSVQGSRAFTVAYIIFGVGVVFAQLSALIARCIQPLYSWSRNATERCFPQKGIDIDGDGTADFKVPRKPLFYYSKNLAAPFVIVMSIQGAFAAVFCEIEGWDFWSACYHCFVTMTTVGFGDVKIHTDGGRMWAFFHILISVSILTATLNDVSELFDARKAALRRMKMIEGAADVGLMLSLDKDGNGVDKFEFVTGMLIMLDGVKQQDLDLFSKLFEKLDIDGSGLIDANDITALDPSRKTASRRASDNFDHEASWAEDAFDAVEDAFDAVGSTMGSGPQTVGMAVDRRGRLQRSNSNSGGF